MCIICHFSKFFEKHFKRHSRLIEYNNFIRTGLFRQRSDSSPFLFCFISAEILKALFKRFDITPIDLFEMWQLRRSSIISSKFRSLISKFSSPSILETISEQYFPTKASSFLDFLFDPSRGKGLKKCSIGSTS